MIDIYDRSSPTIGSSSIGASIPPMLRWSLSFGDRCIDID